MSNQANSNSLAANSAKKLMTPKFNADHLLDTQGLNCPEPVMMLHKAIRKAKAGESIEVIATDPATTRDIPNFCRHLGHPLLEEVVESQEDHELYYYLLQKKS